MSASIDQYNQFLRSLTATRVGTYFDDPGVAVEDVPESELRDVYGSWVAMIMVAGNSLKTTLKAHFQSRPVREVMKRRNGEEGDIPSARIHDFIKELLNLCAGQLKVELERGHSDAGISLPLLLSGIDELFYSSSRESRHVIDQWTIVSPAHQVRIVFSHDTEILDERAIESLELSDPRAAQEAEGDMDLL